ncbi:hypothetical protein [Dyadobacter sp. Leaf189]|uniref:hypothetical protein n=1 Tax=Dyadobacter sp. Leaf189 TaxID=1736295 RepID=UPI0006FC8AF5|nr:hypothetical protein [Dyadobacter sp. Leaf189]KQS27995.1 hypothetical protein ASG33_16505 [Dyadobacter sp. Leaf189]
MKRYALILLLGLIFSCKNEKADPEIPAGVLSEIIQDGKVQTRFEYGDGRVARILGYSSCDTPYETSEFSYSRGRISSIRKGSRGMYSSWNGALCDPNGKFDYQDYTVEYNAEGHRSKVVGKNLTADIEYTGRNARVSVLYHAEKTRRLDLFKFDDHGNVIERQNGAPNSVGPSRYEYDKHPNPFAGLNTNVWPDPFTSPNNVIRAFDYNGDLQWERKFTYDSAGRPLTCDEGNGVRMEFHYR